LSNAVISWKHRQAHDVRGFGKVNEWLRKAEDILRRAGYFGETAHDALDDDSSGIDI
jgi:hypothetical protein